MVFYRLCIIFCYIFTNLFSFYIYYFLDVNKTIDVTLFLFALFLLFYGKENVLIYFKPPQIDLND